MGAVAVTTVVGSDVTDGGTGDEATGADDALADSGATSCATPFDRDAEGMARAELPIATRTTRAIAIESKRTSGFAHRFAAICPKKPGFARLSENAARAGRGVNVSVGNVSSLVI